MDVIYHYDGSFEGFLCCVHESVYTRTIPLNILPEDDAALVRLLRGGEYTVIGAD